MIFSDKVNPIQQFYWNIDNENLLLLFFLDFYKNKNILFVVKHINNKTFGGNLWKKFLC